MRKLLILISLLCALAAPFRLASAEAATPSVAVADTASVPPKKYPWGTVDIYMGLDLHYKDIWVTDNRLFDLLINLTPGVKWYLPRNWEIAAQVLVPIVNDYGSYYKNVRLYMATVSKQFAVGKRWRSKVSAGIFSLERYGIDWKNMVLINRWLAITAQVGITGHLYTGPGWNMSEMKRISALVGPEFYIDRWNLQISLKGGRYIYEDYGAECEVFRHFRHVSVGAYGLYSNQGSYNAGFKIVVMLPPYKRKQRVVNFRPASNFRLDYCAEADNYANLNYRTDPEQNERTGWFARDLLPWGFDCHKPDVEIVGGSDEASKASKEHPKDGAKDAERATHE